MHGQILEIIQIRTNGLSMKKYILDTNFVLRYLLADHKDNYEFAKKIFDQAQNRQCQMELHQTVFAEIIFVLSSFYEVPKEKIVHTLKALLSYQGMTGELDIYNHALDIYLKYNIHIVDAIIAVKSLTNGSELLTFDKKLKTIIKKESFNPHKSQ